MPFWTLFVVALLAAFLVYAIFRILEADDQDEMDLQEASRFRGCTFLACTGPSSEEKIRQVMLNGRIRELHVDTQFCVWAHAGSPMALRGGVGVYHVCLVQGVKEDDGHEDTMVDVALFVEGSADHPFYWWQQARPVNGLVAMMKGLPSGSETISESCELPAVRIYSNADRTRFFVRTMRRLYR